MTNKGVSTIHVHVRDRLPTTKGDADRATSYKGRRSSFDAMLCIILLPTVYTVLEVYSSLSRLTYSLLPAIKPTPWTSRWSSAQPWLWSWSCVLCIVLRLGSSPRDIPSTRDPVLSSLRRPRGCPRHTSSWGGIAGHGTRQFRRS